MKKIDSLEIRTEMVEMHEEYLNRIKLSIEKKNYIEVSWLCYAIFEQRTNRVIEKVISQCTLKEGKPNRVTAISTKLCCIKKLSEAKYAGINKINVDTIKDIEQWCRDRNSLIHDLVRIDRYRNFDEEFKDLADAGNQLVEKYYSEISEFRKWYQEDDNMLDVFPVDHCKECKKKEKCLIT